MARAHGSYPWRRGFDSLLRYHIFWPLGQAVKTPPFHGGYRGSNPLGVTTPRAHSSAGRASALQAEGHRFEPYCAHHLFITYNTAAIAVFLLQSGGR